MRTPESHPKKPHLHSLHPLIDLRLHPLPRSSPIARLLHLLATLPNAQSIIRRNLNSPDTAPDLPQEVQMSSFDDYEAPLPHSSPLPSCPPHPPHQLEKRLSFHRLKFAVSSLTER